jgi:hypothetical protein
MQIGEEGPRSSCLADAADGAPAEGESVDAFGEDVGDVVGAFE